MFGIITVSGAGTQTQIQPSGPDASRHSRTEAKAAGTSAGLTGTLTLTVKQRGLQQSILKSILDEYLQTTNTITRIVADNPGALGQITGDLENRRSYTEQVSFSDALPDTMLGFFYALIAMACMYSSFWGLRNTMDVQADLSPRGARRSVAPTHKLQVVLADAAAALVISFAEVVLLIAYMGLALNVRFGGQLGYVLLTCLAGCTAGVAQGTFIGTFVRGSEGVKTGILVGTNMTLSFLAGLMWVDIKHIINLKAPVLSYINPAALIADAFYSLYVFDTYRRFFINICMLCLISAVLCGVSFLRLRRERYESI